MGNPFTGTDAHLAGHDVFWVVELRDTTSTPGPYTWVIAAFDAKTGDLVGSDLGPNRGPKGIVGPATEPPYFDQLPDHGAACPPGIAVTTRPTAPRTTTVAPSVTGTTSTCSGARSCPPGPTPPCPANQAQPSFGGRFCGPDPGPGNGFGPSGECNGRETLPPCGAGMIPGRYYAYTLPGRCVSLTLDGRTWYSELPPPNPVPDMNVWVSIDAAGDHAGFISPNGAVGFSPGVGGAPACTGNR